RGRGVCLTQLPFTISDSPFTDSQWYLFAHLMIVSFFFASRQARASLWRSVAGRVLRTFTVVVGFFAAVFCSPEAAIAVDSRSKQARMVIAATMDLICIKSCLLWNCTH